jgi:hypothetical protein
MGPQSPAPDPRLPAAAYGLALRIAGDAEGAAASVEAASRRSPPTAGAFVRAVREEARARRPLGVAGASAAIVAPPLARVAADDWDVLERVALRGMLVGEAAQEVGLERREALLRLHRGLVAARRGLVGGQEARDDPGAAFVARLRGDLAAGSLDDTLGDRQPEAAAVA